MKDQMLLIGLVVALGVGFLMGRESAPSPTLPPPARVDYDPARAIAADALKSEKDSSERCWKEVVALLKSARATPAPTAAAQ